MSDNSTARQFWVKAPGHGEIVTAEMPPRQEDEVLVRTLYSGISRGTEALVFRGEVPPSQHLAMRAPFQEGEHGGPVKYGYISVGDVIEAPNARSELTGRTVFCLHPHQDVYCVPAHAVAPVPDDVPPGRAILAANMETAVNAIWDARPTAGDHIVVIGAGVVGLLIGWLSRQMPGADVTMVDVNPERASVAGALGLELTTSAPESAEADLVFHASGNPEGLAASLAVAGVEGTIVDVSWYGTRTVPLPLGEAFHSRRLRIVSSQVGRIPANRAARWSFSRRMGLALDLIRDPCLDALITGESDFEDLPWVMTRLSRDPGSELCHRIRYPKAD